MKLLSQKINLRVKLGDKEMLRNVAIAHEVKSLSAMVLETIRKECKYAVYDVKGKNVNAGGGVMDIETLKQLELEPVFPQDIAYQQECILCFSVSKEEIKHIQEYAHLMHFIGVPSFVLWLLRDKGFISKKPVVSNSEITLEGGVQDEHID